MAHATYHDDVTTAAKASAATFAEEFPGERLGESDWDSEAYAIDSAGKGWPSEAWELYRETLEAEIDRLASVADDDIRALRTEAGEAGDEAQVILCDEALAGDQEARQECVRAILDARAQA